jgi:hypothetical protein
MVSVKVFQKHCLPSPLYHSFVYCMLITILDLAHLYLRAARNFQLKGKKSLRLLSQKVKHSF